jgi:hypothetical protein
MPSQEILAALPDIEALRKLSQSLAMLDAIMSPDWEYRYYSFNSKWGEGEMMASMRNGCGDGYFILFNSVGAIMKGFAHESEMSPWNFDPGQVWLGVLSDVPSEFDDFLREPAFGLEETTFCVWRKFGDDKWQAGNIAYPPDSDPDGSEEMLKTLIGQPEAYINFASWHYEKELSLLPIVQVYQHQPLTDELIAQLNEEVSISSLQNDLEEIGYPGDKNEAIK